VPVAPPGPPPEGLLRQGDDWLYSEWAEGGWIQRIGADGVVVKAAPPPGAASAPPPAPVEQFTQ
jgi:penicillin-binding protein 1A